MNDVLVLETVKATSTVRKLDKKIKHTSSITVKHLKPENSSSQVKNV